MNRLPFGFCVLLLPFLFASSINIKAKTRDVILPTNIIRVIIILGRNSSDDVIPVLIPTVPIADIHSNRMSEYKSSGWHIVIIVDAINTSVRLMMTMDTAFLITSTVILFPKISISLELRSVAAAHKNSTAIVAVFIPPAVEPVEPPISIRIYVISFDGADSSAFDTLLKPAVLGVVLAKKAFNTFCPSEKSEKVLLRSKI